MDRSRQRELWGGVPDFRQAPEVRKTLFCRSSGARFSYPSNPGLTPGATVFRWSAVGGTSLSTWCNAGCLKKCAPRPEAIGAPASGPASFQDITRNRAGSEIGAPTGRRVWAPGLQSSHPCRPGPLAGRW